MKRNPINSFLLAISALLFAVTFVPTIYAQTPTPTPQLFLVTTTHVKPGMLTEYREFLKNETLPAFKKAGGTRWATYTNATFGKGNVIITLRAVEGMKYFDEPNFLTKALGEAGTQAWLQKRAAMIEGTETYLTQTLPELNIPRPTTDAPKLLISTTTNVAPGRTAEYERLMKSEVLPLLKKAGSKGFSIGRVLFGGDVNEYRSLGYADSFEDVEKTGQALQAAGYGALTAKFAGIVLHSERRILRYLPELSLRPEPQKAAK
jgi:hypothetical protein